MLTDIKILSTTIHYLSPHSLFVDQNKFVKAPDGQYWDCWYEKSDDTVYDIKSKWQIIQTNSSKQQYMEIMIVYRVDSLFSKLITYTGEGNEPLWKLITSIYMGSLSVSLGCFAQISLSYNLPFILPHPSLIDKALIFIKEWLLKGNFKQRP